MEPFDQITLDEFVLSVILFPWQNVVLPFAEITGADGIGFAVTIIGEDVEEHVLFVTKTE